VTDAADVLGRLPRRIDVDGGIVVRTYVDTDIATMVDVVNHNLEHLRPWMPWAQEPATAEAQLAWLRGSGVIRDDGTADLPYGIFDADGRLLGGTGFHVRGAPDAIEIGYWLDAAATGRGVMTLVVGALVDAVRGLAGLRRVEIKCDEANKRSAAVPRRLGFRFTAVEDREPAAAAESGHHQVWTLDLPG
jgi:RimJ/RimL family protein N-acetyltransferase